MPSASLLLPTRQDLRLRSRFRKFTADQLRLADLAILAGAGFVAAAATALLDFDLRIPGHAILRTVLPLSIGYAFVPRRGSGVVMSGFAGLSLAALRAAGASGGGPGALTSLLLAGPLLDIASHWSRRGWQIYLTFAAAGLVCNLAALSVRWATKAAYGGRGMGGGQGLGGGRGLGGSRAMEEWRPTAVITYAVCGLLAGLIGAAICFRASKSDDEGSQSQ